MAAQPVEIVKTCATCGGQFPQDALFCPVDGTPLRRISGTGTEPPSEADPYLKAEIAGHIEIRQLAGIGAMGRVYRAFQRGIDRDVAVKILHRELSSNPQLVSRFTREAKVASKLQHPNVVSVLLTGQMPDSALYIVMEYLDGMSLMSALAASGGALPLTRALHIAVQLADAVGEAHAMGIIHRDLKPENVMLVRRGEDHDYVKVLDFGIARMHWGDQSMATAAGLIFGTARYISPEGARGEAVTEASDVYSIATLAYQMISGRTPFEGDQAVGLLVQQIHDQPPYLKSLSRAAYVPAQIADVIMQNLAKQPEAREPDARAFGRALIDAARAAGLSAEEISRPTLMGRPSAVSLPSIARTRQLEISKDVRDQMASSPDDPRATPEPVRASGTGVGAAGNATVKWTPPANIAAKLAEIPPRASMAAAPDSAPASAQSSPSLDATLDDATPSFPPLPSVPTPPPSAPAASFTTAPMAQKLPPQNAPQNAKAKTEYATPSPEVVAQIPTPAPSAPIMQPAPVARQTYPSKPPSNVDTTLNGEDAKARNMRAIILVLLCFVLGAGVATTVAYRLGRIGPDAGHEELVTLAQNALSANHLVDPPGENVRDLTTTGMKKWPDDSRFITMRKRAAEELTARAISAHAQGATGTAESVRLIKLAMELDPEATSAKKLAQEWDVEAQPKQDDPAAITSARPLSIAPRNNWGAPPNTSPLPSTQVAPPAVSAGAGVKLAFDVSNPHPRVGAQVDFLTHVTGGKKVEDAHYTIVSPTVGATSIVAAEDSGAYRGGFTFLEAGKYDVTFNAKVDGAPVRAQRSVVAGDPATQQTAAPLPTPTPPTPQPPPSGTVKWM